MAKLKIFGVILLILVGYLIILVRIEQRETKQAYFDGLALAAEIRAEEQKSKSQK